MNPFEQPVSAYMTSAIEVVGLDATLADVARRLDDRRVSAVPVVGLDGAIAGVVSRTDLVHVGRMQAGAHRRAPALTLPAVPVTEVLGRAPLVIGRDATVRDAARSMRAHDVHRLFVTDGAGKPVGVISTADLTAAVRDAKVGIPISEIMSAPILTVRPEQPISVAIDKLDRAHLQALVVVDEEWPVGVFTQIDALQARDLPRETPIDDLFDPSVICMPVETRARRAAAQAARLDVRRVIACSHREAVGIVTGLDFAKVAAGATSHG